MESGVEVLHYLKQHYEEESGGDQTESKVSKITTMFQVPGDLEEQDGVHGNSGPQVTVVRTESHVARFNTARALFEKMAEKNSAPEQSQSRQPQRHPGSFAKAVTPPGMGRGGVSPNNGVSLSRSPSPGAIKTGVYSNGHSSTPPYKTGGPVAPQGSSYIATITSMSSSNPVATSSFYPSPPSVLQLSSKKTVDPMEAAKGRWPPGAQLPQKGMESSTTKAETISGRPRPDEALQVEIRLRPEFDSKHHFKNGVAGPDLMGSKDVMSSLKPDLLVKCEPRGRHEQVSGKPLKPAKPETLIDKPLSSHLQNQQIIQRHRNWFQSYSKSKAPLSPPNRSQHPPPSPTSHFQAYSEPRFPVELEKSSSYDNIGQVNKCRKFPVSDDELSPTKNIRSFAKEVQIHKKTTDETPSHHGDWRKERAAILSGRSPRECVEEKRGKGATPEGPKLKTFEEVPTLPSCWSPPKQYNQSAGVFTTRPSTGRVPGESEDDVPRRLKVSPEVQRNLSSVCRGLRRGVAEDAREAPARRSFSEGVALDDRPSPQDTPLVGGEVIWKLRDDLPEEREKRLRDWERKRGHREEVGVHSGLPGEETSRRASLPSADAGRRTSWREDRRWAESRLLQRERSPQEKQPRSEEVRRRRLDEPSVNRATAKRDLEFFDTTARRDEEEEWERKRKEDKMQKRKDEEEELVAKMRETKRREEYEWRRKEKEDQDGARRKEDLEKKKEAELEKSRREKEESERRRRDEEMERKKSEIESERKRKEDELKRKEELERRKKDEEIERRLEKEELERKKREGEELIRRRREEEVLERRRRKEEELLEKMKREAELERRRKEEEEFEKSRKKEVEKRRNDEEKERESRNRDEKEMERRRKEEYERKRRAEMERRKREEEELEKKRAEEEELEKKMREELERKMKEKEMAEMRRKEEEALKRKREEAEIKRKEEEALEKKRKEAEVTRQKEELEMRRREREEAKKRMKEEEEAKRRMIEELEFERKVREKEEAERKRKEKEELDRRIRDEEETERRKKEEIFERRKKEEAERRRKEEEELKKVMEEKELNRRRREEEEAARQRKEEEEAEKRRKEEEETERRRKEEEEAEKRRKEVEEAEMRRKEEAERRKEEEAERRRKEADEAEMRRKEADEAERRRKEEEAERRRRKGEQEAERMKKEEQEAERRRKEEDEAERRKEHEETEWRKREEEAERRRKEEEAKRRWRKEEEEAEISRREEEKAMARKEKEGTEDIRTEENKKGGKEADISKEDEGAGRREAEDEEIDKEKPARPILKEEECKKKRDIQEHEDGRETELKNEEQFEWSEENVREGRIEPRSCSGHASVEDARRWREERRRREEEKIRGELERKWQQKKEKLEEEEKIRRERDRAQIEKTKRRIAELKKEREMMRRQQAIRLRKLMKAEAGEEDEEEEEEFSADEEEFTADSQPDEGPPPSRPELRESKTVDLLAQDELARVIPFSEFENGPEKSSMREEDPQERSQSAASLSPHRARGGMEPEDSIKPTISPAAPRENGDPTRDLYQERSKEANQDPNKADELLYDHTVLSAQHKIEFCTGPYHDPATKEESCETISTSSRGDQVFFASTISSEFEPLPPPIPPHNVDPATLASKEHLDNRLPPPPVPKSDSVSEPEVMTPEEEEKLLSHNILGSKRRVAEEVVETIEDKPGGAEVPADETPENRKVDPDEVDKDYDSVCVDSPTPDEDPADMFPHEITEEGFVIRAKEILIEDGVHYFEDGHFWIQVPGLTDDDEDDLPDSVPVHEHTKLKFSTEPIQLFSTFSVTDYDRKNEDVDPVAASAEYELEKRVEKMDVFPVQIEKGECGLGLSIIGMGVGADAGVEKLGIFVKTITPGGATEEDGRIHVNDQIIEVDNQSLVGVTQMFAASVLKNTSGTVNFLIGRETDPENSEVAMLIRQSLLADHERDERRRALEGPNYDPRNAGIFESFSSQSGGESPSEENPRNLFSHREEEVIQYGEDFGDAYGSCPPSPIEGVSSPTPEAFNHQVMAKELMQNSDMMILSQHLEEAQQKNEMYEEEINILRSKLAQLEKDLGEKVELASSFHETTLKLKDVEDKLQSRQAEIATYQDMLEQSQGQYIILEKKYYKAKKIIKEYQNREKDFLHREEYHITQLEEKDALYNSLVKALKDRVIQLEGDLIKAQQQAGLPIKVPPDMNAQSSNFIHSNAQDNHSPLQKEPPRKPSTISTLDADLSDTEGADTHTSEGSKPSTVERKIPSKEELDVAVPPTELLDNSFSKAKGELASRGGLANRQLPSLKKTSSTTSANSFDNDADEAADECVAESQQLCPQPSPPKSPSALLQEEVHQPPSAPPVTAVSSPVTSPSTGSHPPPPSFGSGSPSVTNFGGRLPPPYHTPHTQASPAHPHHQPPPYQPPPSAPLSHRAVSSPDPHSVRNDTPPHRHPPPIARVQPVNRVEASPGPPPHSQHHHQAQQLPQAQQQQTLAHQLKALLAEREASSDPMHRGTRDTSPLKKSPSSLMEDVRQAVIQADMSIGKKPVISGPIHVSSTAQVVSTGQFVHSRTSPQKGSSVATTLQQRIGRDSGSWSSKLSSEVAPTTPSGGVVLLSQRPIDASLPSVQADENEAAGNRILCTESSFDSQHSDKNTSGISARDIISVFDWTKEQVAQWLVVQGLEVYVSTFMSAGITGPRLINIDTKDLKSLGLSSDDKNKIKRKVKELRQNLEKERKQIEKENKEREKLQKKAEKLAEKAERRKK